jgi:hypothetical protein
MDSSIEAYLVTQADLTAEARSRREYIDGLTSNYFEHRRKGMAADERG